MRKITSLDWTALILVIIGGINWGLVAINQGWNIVENISGGYSLVARIIYALVALSAIYLLVTLNHFLRKV